MCTLGGGLSDRNSLTYSLTSHRIISADKLHAACMSRYAADFRRTKVSPVLNVNCRICQMVSIPGRWLLDLLVVLLATS